MNKRTTRTSSTPKWRFTSLVELNLAATAILRQGIIHERCKQWRRVVECYKHLLWTVSLENLPANYDPPARYGTLIYEVEFHLGVALQRTGEHRKAITCYTKAIDAVSHSKNDCSGGCVTSSCLMTPLYARRAFTYAKIGDLRSAIKDAERAVILDGTNPDVYCVRALVRSTRDEVVEALRDLDHAIKLNPTHMCALILRGALSKPLFVSEWTGFDETPENKYHTQAVKINPDSQAYLSVLDVNHPVILDFYDKFLFALNVPHTLDSINLTPDQPKSTKHKDRGEMYISPARSKSDGHHHFQPSSESPSLRPSPVSMRAQSTCEPFRCGTPGIQDSKSTSIRRRMDYSESLRKVTTSYKTPTADEYFAKLKAMTWKSHSTNDKQATVPKGTQHSSEDNTSASLKPSSNTKESRNTSSKVTFAKVLRIQSPTRYNIPVFQKMNIQSAPRMYYRPWVGDKIPVADVERKTYSPAFY